MIHVLDLNFLGIDHAIASFLVETTDGPVLIETGPHSTFENLRTKVEEKGFRLNEIKHVLLTHIHLDHAGAAWALAEMGATIYLHPFGEKHMADPSKLMASAKLIYQDDMDRLWGMMKPVPANKLKVMDHKELLKIGDKTFISLHTPGHARHHIAWQMDNIIFSGDVAGVKIGDGPVVPPCPPPDINLEDWNESIELILNVNPDRIYLTHFDAIENADQHMAELKVILNDWAFWIKEHWETGQSAEEITPKFSAYTADQLRERGVCDHGIDQYEAANPSWMSVAGLIRYWKKKQESH